jgi:hypothetical protein
MAADKGAAAEGVTGWGGVTARTGGGVATGVGVAADGSAAADGGAAAGGVACWGGMKAWTGVAGKEGVIIVCGGVCGGEKQLSTCGICRFFASTKAQLLVRVACCMFQCVSAVVVLMAAIEPVEALCAAMVVVLFAETWRLRRQAQQ